MNHSSTRNALALIGLFGLACACSKHEPASNPTPVIAFQSLRKIALAANATKARRDSVIVSIKFSDGDGDLGENVRDSTRIKTVFGNQLWGNYQIRAFRLVNNDFEEITPSPAPKLFVSLGAPTPSSVLPEIGTLDYSQLFLYSGAAELLPVKFQIQMRDRNLNESNVVETDTVRLPVGQ